MSSNQETLHVFCGIFNDIKWRDKRIIQPKDKAAKKMTSKIVLNHLITQCMLIFVADCLYDRLPSS